MKLLVDVGNSRVKWCSTAGYIRTEGGQCEHQRRDIGLVTKAAWEGMNRPEGVLVSNVAGSPAEAEIFETADELWGVSPRFVRTGLEFAGLKNGYRLPERLGVDRWVAIVGARALALGAIGVVDCGTAITMDYVDADGQHRGGLILPGVGLMRRSLAASTGDLPMARENACNVLAIDTAEGIAAGTFLSAVSSVRMFRDEIESLGGDPVTWFLTGGGGGLIASSMPAGFRHEPDLVLIGLTEIDNAQSIPPWGGC